MNTLLLYSSIPSPHLCAISVTQLHLYTSCVQHSFIITPLCYFPLNKVGEGKFFKQDIHLNCPLYLLI